MVVDHNGSERHKRSKRKVASILRKSGFLVKGDEDDEFALFRSGEQPPYYLDLIASNNERVLAVEIDGYKGHTSRRAILHDRHRFQEIRELVKDIECYRFAFYQLAGMPDDLIAKELRLC